MSDHADMKFHEGTYVKVIAFLKWLTIVSVIITAIVIWLIAG